MKYLVNFSYPVSPDNMEKLRQLSGDTDIVEILVSSLISFDKPFVAQANAIFDRALIDVGEIASQTMGVRALPDLWIPPMLPVLAAWMGSCFARNVCETGDTSPYMVIMRKPVTTKPTWEIDGLA